MSDSHSAFTGSIPENYDKYLGPLIFRDYAKDIASRVRVPSSGIVLEIAAGSGMATRQLRSTLSSTVKLVATDLNADMLDLARKKFDVKENIEFQVANTLNLPFDENDFDAVVCQFSLMFFPDKLAALKEAARVLKPDGVFIFNVWDSMSVNHFVRSVNSVITKSYINEAPNFFSTPYGYYDIEVIRNLVSKAGFKKIDISILPGESKADSARDVAHGYIFGTPIRLQIEEEGSKSPMDVAIKVDESLTMEYGAGEISAHMQAIVFEARL